MIKGAIFDFDGTLFDSMGIWEPIVEEGLRIAGINNVNAAELMNEIKTMSLRQSSELFREKYKSALSAEEFFEQTGKAAEDFYMNRVQPKPGVTELLERMYQSKIRMCVATASQRYLIEAALKRCEMECFFAGILTCADVDAGKDDPAIFRKAAELLEIRNKDILVFEDAYHAAKTAKDDGFRVVGVYDFYETEKDALKSCADIYLQDFSDTESIWRLVSHI